ncbi:MAG: ergothioneine biosynthesis protein EgtB [Candidatus Dormibacteraeota bacterium]|jgi:gamma-glutamyl hercynylcysteine S-oxide synthase|nr:ergothioneine biosynthesis protein EgtB [Candidatus Dormibacteraeota bacterium]
MDLKERIVNDLTEARLRTNELLAPLDEERLTTQYDQLMSPPVWDYAHIGVFEELWLVQTLSGAAPIDQELQTTYNAIETPRVVRGRKKLLGVAESVDYLARVRDRTLALLEEVTLDEGDPLLRDGFVYDLIIQHEHQHDETILQTLQLTPGVYRERLPELPAAAAVDPAMVSVPAGLYPIGSDTHEPYDNEHRRHEVQLDPFEIDRLPVSNGDYLAFIEDGGYARQEHWSSDGWEWRWVFDVRAPEYWSEQDGQWTTSRFGHRVPLDPRLPVSHVSYFEADAFARWAGKRLPTEVEWEVAASWDPQPRVQRRHPWGDEPPTAGLANLGQSLLSTAPVGAYPLGASPLGCQQMLGDVWEWTSSDFRPYPGFVAFPYAEYSEPFFGDGFKVLRGGSWATMPRLARTTFRNWDSRLKRQIFAGFRCARSAGSR